MISRDSGLRFGPPSTLFVLTLGRHHMQVEEGVSG